MAEYQVWYRKSRNKKVEYRVILAESAAAARASVLKEDPEALIGIIAPIDTVEIDHNHSFISAISDLQLLQTIFHLLLIR